MNIRYQFFSKDKDVTQELMDIIKIFVKHSDEFNSYNKELCSNEVLSCISNDLKQLGYKIKETRNGPDAINKQHKIIVEVENASDLKSALRRAIRAYDSWVEDWELEHAEYHLKHNIKYNLVGTRTNEFVALTFNNVLDKIRKSRYRLIKGYCNNRKCFDLTANVVKNAY